MAKRWVQIIISIDSSYQDLLTGLLTNLAFNGFLQEDNSFSCFMEFSKFNPAVLENFKSVINRFKHEFPRSIKSFRIKTFAERNWNKVWEKKIGIVKATSRIIIRPSWKILPDKYRNNILINIDPKMSFGTGHHETTRLSLKLIERFIKPNMKVLDFGCGTGILGIACIKLGATSVLAVDNDEWAVKNASENIRKNKVQNKMEVILGSISVVKSHTFDLITANIDYKTISRYMHPLVIRLRKQGVIIISGILTNDLPPLLPLFKKEKLELINSLREKEWISIALRKMG